MFFEPGGAAFVLWVPREQNSAKTPVTLENPNTDAWTCMQCLVEAL